MALSSSPTSVDEEIRHVGATAESRDGSGPIDMADFVNALPPILRRQKEFAKTSLKARSMQCELRGTADDPVSEMFGRIDLGLGEWEKYALFDSSKNYTRNLIATDDETFTLLLLCWNPGKGSPIHDHPGDGCWVRVCQGKIQETRYVINDETDRLDVTSDKVFEGERVCGDVLSDLVEENIEYLIKVYHVCANTTWPYHTIVRSQDDAPTFINNSMGYHKVGNPSDSRPAVTLHLYCPPIRKCKIWLDPGRASCPSNAYMCNYSEHGVKNTRAMFEVHVI